MKGIVGRNMNSYGIGYLLTIVAFIITLVAQVFVNQAYHKYSNVQNKRRMTGREAARYILDKNNLQDVDVVEVNGYLSDHYDPTKKQVRLSRKVYREDSIASVAVACHECGHALQDKEHYFFLKIRSSFIPIVNFSSYAGYVALMIGIFFQLSQLIWLGILLEVVILLFQFLTLPVEINASRRALKELDYAHFFTSQELKQSQVVLAAAASTYLASIATTFLEILRLIILFGNREDS